MGSNMNINQRDLRDEYKIGDGASVKYWTDIVPATVIKVTRAGLILREDKTTRDPNWTPEIIAGGFAGHCVNQYEQKWIIEPDPEGQIFTARIHKNGFIFADKTLRVLKGRRKYYDYNF